MGATPAEGWYRDPFGIHSDRWMSQGQPTRLARDGGAESYDPPPDLPLPAALEPADAVRGDAVRGDAVRGDAVRGDAAGSPGSGEAGQEPGYSDRRARRAAFDAITGGALVDEPGGDW